jgi:hypothetical protein
MIQLPEYNSNKSQWTLAKSGALCDDSCGTRACALYLMPTRQDLNTVTAPITRPMVFVSLFLKTMPADLGSIHQFVG